MSAQPSSTARRVLSDLNVNTPTSKGAGTSPDKTSTITNSTLLFKESLPQEALVSPLSFSSGLSPRIPLSTNAPLGHSSAKSPRLSTEMARKVVEKDQHAGSKRLSSNEGNMDSEKKRVKIQGSERHRDRGDSLPFSQNECVGSNRFGQQRNPTTHQKYGADEIVESGLGPHRKLSDAEEQTRPGSAHEEIQSVPTSPASSIDSVAVDMNESQNTIITEPDDVPPNPTPLSQSTLTTVQVREKARAIKLRLSLASYKVRTNQIDIPISRLQIKSASPRISSLSRASNISRRTPLPTAPGAPNLRLKQPIINSIPPYYTLSSSPPRVEKSQSPENEVTPVSPQRIPPRETLSTPILPRQRQSLLVPPNLRSPIWDDRKSDLTSSIMKGRAADGLLSLREQKRGD